MDMLVRIPTERETALEDELNSLEKDYDRLRELCEELASEMGNVCKTNCEYFPECEGSHFSCDHAGLREALAKYEQFVKEDK